MRAFAPLALSAALPNGIGKVGTAAAAITQRRADKVSRQLQRWKTKVVAADPRKSPRVAVPIAHRED